MLAMLTWLNCHAACVPVVYNWLICPARCQDSTLGGEWWLTEVCLTSVLTTWITHHRRREFKRQRTFLCLASSLFKACSPDFSSWGHFKPFGNIVVPPSHFVTFDILTKGLFFYYFHEILPHFSEGKICACSCGFTLIFYMPALIYLFLG